MKRVVVLLGTLLCWSTPHAQSPQSLAPLQKGYAFDQRRILIQQRLFGFAHVVTLLESVCLADGAATKGRDALLLAYALWDKEQSTTLEEIQRDLARYYFGDRAAEAKWTDIAAAINLRQNLGLKPGSLEMIAACDSLPETLQKPRYNLRQLFQLQSLAARIESARKTEARAEACQGHLTGEARQTLIDGMQHWHDAYGAMIDEARTRLEQQWADSQIEGTLDNWLAQAQEKGKRAAKAKSEVGSVAENDQSCAAMSAWLLTSQADPDDEFKPKP